MLSVAAGATTDNWPVNRPRSGATRQPRIDIRCLSGCSRRRTGKIDQEDFDHGQLFRTRAATATAVLLLRAVIGLGTYRPDLLIISRWHLVCEDAEGCATAGVAGDEERAAVHHDP